MTINKNWHLQNRTKKALLLHGWYQKSDDNWYPWLKENLVKKGYKVFIPDLPIMRTNLPDMDKQLKAIKNMLDIDEKTTVIGHSLGAVLALRLAEITSYRKMILISGWDFDDLTREHRLFWKNKIDHKKIKKNIKEIYCISSDNDPYITAFQSQEMSKRLNGKFILVKKAGHFLGKPDGITEIPLLLDFI